jgi:hypothetical protein
MSEAAASPSRPARLQRNRYFIILEVMKDRESYSSDEDWQKFLE